MFDQFFDTFRKAAESSLQMQNEMLKYWSQQWASAMPNAPADATDAGQTQRNRFVDLSIELLNKHRESIDAAYTAGIQMIQQTFRASDARSPDDYRNMVEGLWRKLFETFKTQAETQFDAFQKWSTKSAEAAHDDRSDVRS
jgi:hypothetical protein